MGMPRTRGPYHGPAMTSVTRTVASACTAAARPAPGEQIRRCHPQTQEGEDHDLPKRRVRRHYTEHEAGEARNERRIERRARENSRHVSGREAAPAQDGAFEVVGVVPFR